MSEAAPRALPTHRVSCIALIEDADILESWKQVFLGVGFELVTHQARDLAHAQSLLREHDVQFVLGAAAEFVGEDSLTPRFLLKSVHLPPLALVTRIPLAEAESERCRLNGAAAIIEHPLKALQDELVLWELARSGRWFSGALDQIEIPELLADLASDRRSVMVGLSCPHSQAVSSATWGEAGAQCDRGLGPTRCGGWSGRIYLHGGTLLHAETPNTTGLAALGQLLALERGRFRVSELYIPPSVASLNTSLEAALASVRPAPRVQRSPLSQAQSTEASPRSGEMRGLDVLFAEVPGVGSIARADLNGNVIESAGPADADSLCATVTMARKSLESLAAGLGLGTLKSWAFTHETGSLYVHQAAAITVAAAQPARNPHVILKKVTLALESEP